jgi:hypothetical protein
MKSLLIAIATLLLVVLVWGQQQPLRPAATKPEVGRFQIVAQPGTAGEVFLLDTSTGKVWREVLFQIAKGDDNGLDGAPWLWIPMTRLDSKTDLVAFVARHPEEKK